MADKAGLRPPDIAIVDRLLREAAGKEEGRIAMASLLLGPDAELLSRQDAVRAVVTRGRELLRDVAVDEPDSEDDEEITSMGSDYYRTTRI